MFHRTKTSNSKLIWNHKGPQTAMSTLRKKNRVGGNTASDMKLFYNTMVIKTAWYWHKNRRRSMEENEESRSKIMPIQSIIFDKGMKNIKWGKDSLFNKQWWDNRAGTQKKKKVDHFLTSY